MGKTQVSRRFWLNSLVVFLCYGVLSGMLVSPAGSETQVQVTVTAIVAFGSELGPNVVDDFEDAPDGYNPLPETNPVTLTAMNEAFEGSRAMRFAFDSAAPWQGAWKSASRDPTVTDGKTEFRIYVRGDGSRHRMQLEVVAGATTYISSNFYTSSKDWEEIRIPFANFRPAFPAGTAISGINLIFPADDSSDPPAFAKQLFKANSFQDVDIWTAEDAPTVGLLEYVSLRPQENAIKLSWPAVDGAAQYRVYRSVNVGKYESITLQAGNTYTDSTVSMGNTYQYKVAALDVDSKEGPASNPSNYLPFDGGAVFALNESEGFEGAELYYFQGENYNDISPTEVIYDTSTAAKGAQSYRASVQFKLDPDPNQSWSVWQMNFPVPIDLSDLPTLNFWFKGDGSGNRLKFNVLARRSGDPTKSDAWKWVRTIPLSDTEWHLVSVPTRELTWDVDSSDEGGTSIAYTGKDIVRYGFVYLTSNQSAATYNIDNFYADTSSPPPGQGVGGPNHLVDNFEEGIGLYNPQGGAKPASLSMVGNALEGKQTLRFSFDGDPSVVWQGMWRTLTTPADLDEANVVETYFRGDGSRHRVKVGVQVVGEEEVHFSPDFYTSTKDGWEQIRIPYDRFLNERGGSFPLPPSGTLTVSTAILPADNATLLGDNPKQFFKAGSFLETDQWQLVQAATWEAPGSVFVDELQANAFTVTWPVVTGAERYGVYRSEGTSGYVKLAEVIGTTHVDTNGLASGRSYQYKVGTVKEGQEGPASNPSNPVIVGKPLPLNLSEGAEGVEVFYFQHQQYGETHFVTDVRFDSSTFAPGKPEGTQSYRVSQNGFIPGFWTAWQTAFPNQMDLSGRSVVRFWIKGDGSTNLLKFSLFSPYEANPELFYAWKFEEPVTLLDSEWHKIEIPVERLVWDANAAGEGVPQKLYDGKGISRYGFTYLDTNSSGSTYTVDWVEADDELPVSPVENLSTKVEGRQIRLTWKNPNSSNFSGIRVVARTDRHPTSATDGEMVEERGATRGAEDQFLHQNLLPGTRYYYAVFAFDTGKRFSSASLADGLTSTDATGPTISEVKVAGVRLFDKEIIPAKPEITAEIRDAESEVKSEDIRLFFSKDGEEILTQTGELEYNPVTSMMRYKKKDALSPGTYNLHIEAQDVSGNVSSYEAKGLQVLAGDVTLIGRPLNYKNPFDPVKEGGTHLTYTLSVDSTITLYLYDMNAHLIWRRTYFAGENGGKGGFNDVLWKGADDFGNIVGNGVYIVKIVAEQGSSKKVLGTIKLSVIRY